MWQGSFVMRGLLILLVLVGISVGVFALGKLRSEDGDKPLLNVAEDVALTVNIARPEEESIVRLVQAPGEVEPVVEVEISSEIVARIEELPVEEGDFVKKGDLLCRLDDDKLLAELESARARIAQLRSAIDVARPDVDKASRDLERQKRLAETNATSSLEMADYLTTHLKAKATLSMRQHELTQAQAGEKRILEDLTRAVIESPIDGIVAKLNAEQGEVVVTGTMNNAGTVVMVISDLAEMQVRARVDEVDVPLVKPGQKARIYLQADSEVPIPAEVVRVATKGTRLSGRDVVTFETLLKVLSNDPRIKSGMTANTEIEVAQSDGAVTVPVEAVIHRMRKELSEEIVKEFNERQENTDLSDRARHAQFIKVIYVIEDGKAAVRLVDPGIADTRRVELKSGIGMDDLVIIGPYRSLDQLEDGKKVTVADEDKELLEPADDSESDAEAEDDDAALAQGEKP